MSMLEYPVNCGLVPLDNKLIVLNRKTMQWIAVPKSASSCLEALLVGVSHAGNSSTQEAKLREKLESIGLCTSKNSPKVLPTSTPKSILVRIQLTDRCNFACRYCFNETVESCITMTWDTLRKSIDLFFHHPSKEQGIKFLFYGGEATLEWNLFLKGVGYIMFRSRKMGVQVHICLITNGVLLTEDRARLLMKRRIGVGISFDGYGVNDQTRVNNCGSGTSSAILRSLELFQDYPLLYVLTTVTKYNDRHIYEIITDLQSRGIPSVAIRPFVTLNRAYSLKFLCLNSRNYITDLRQVVEGIENGEIWNIRVEEILRMLLPLITTDQLYSDSKSHRCSAGRTVFYVSCRGELKGCDDFPSALLPPIGMVQDGKYDFVLLNKAVENHAFKDPTCQRCNWLYICKGGCPGHAASENNTFESRYRLGCSVQHALYPQLLNLISEKESVLKKYFIHHMSQLKHFI